MKYPKTLLLFVLVALVFCACTKRDSPKADKLTGTWTLAEYSANGGPWASVTIGWPRGIVNKIEFRDDSSFTKTIILDGQTNVGSGMYRVGMFDNKKYVGLTYNNKDVLTNKVVQGCGNSEGFFWTNNTLENLFWSPCDGPDLKFARQP